MSRAAAAALSILVASGCEGLLEVELPGEVTLDGLYQPGQAELLVTSAITHIECAYSDFIAATGSGAADIYQKPWFFWGTSHEYEGVVPTGPCNPQEFAWGWWDWMQAGRLLADQAYERISGWPAAEVANRDRLLAQAAIYSAIPRGLFGEIMCEVTYEAGPLLSWDESLGEAEALLTTALEHIAEIGDFPMPSTISSSAEDMARALRARYRFARGDLTGALEDAAAVPTGFVAYITRDAVADRTRHNRVNNGHHGTGMGTIQGPINWWDGPPDPITGEPWPDVIPFTGYRNLGVLPDGRAISDGTPYPVTTTAYPDAVPDPRVDVFLDPRLTSGYPWWQTTKYTSDGDDMPLVSWEEMRLIQAEILGGQAAIDRVNEIRAAHDLPLVTYVDPQNEEQVLNMIIEEFRRSLFLEGTGFWTVKLRHGLWFPRGVGSTPGTVARGYQGGVRMVMPQAEFDLHPDLDISMRGMHCPAGQEPIL